MKSYLFYLMAFSFQMAFSAGEWKVNAGYSRNHSPLLDNIHRNYAFTRLSNDSGVSLLRNGFFFQLGARFANKKSFPVYTTMISWSRFTASHSRPDFIDVALHRINLLPAIGIDLWPEGKHGIHLSAGPIAGLHIFSVNKYAQPLQLEEGVSYRPAFFNWGIHTEGAYRFIWSKTQLAIFIQAEWFPVYYSGNYSSALSGTAYPWLADKGFAMNLNCGLSWALPWKLNVSSDTSSSSEINK
jgi:hypothetical protein